MSVELRGVLQSHVVWLSAAILFCVPLAPFLRERANRWIGNAGVLGTIGVVRNTIALAVATALLVADSYNPFLYFRF
jgi:alginate O-acetyltransferase complex protein AlgI